MVVKIQHITYRYELHSGNIVPTEYHCLALPVKAQHKQNHLLIIRHCAHLTNIVVIMTTVSAFCICCSNFSKQVSSKVPEKSCQCRDNTWQQWQTLYH